MLRPFFQRLSIFAVSFLLISILLLQRQSRHVNCETCECRYDAEANNGVQNIRDAHSHSPVRPSWIAEPMNELCITIRYE